MVEFAFRSGLVITGIKLFNLERSALVWWRLIHVRQTSTVSPRNLTSNEKEEDATKQIVDEMIEIVQNWSLQVREYKRFVRKYIQVKVIGRKRSYRSGTACMWFSG